ncbi:unnamed protein product, partial [Polarella glacialis]
MAATSLTARPLGVSRVAGAANKNGIASEIIALGRAKQWEAALATLHGARPSQDNAWRASEAVSAYSAAISASTKASQWLLGLELVASLRLRGLVPDAVVYGTSAAAWGRGQQWQGSLGVLRELHHDRLTPNAIIWGTALNVCAKRQEWRH